MPRRSSTVISIAWSCIQVFRLKRLSLLSTALVSVRVWSFMASRCAHILNLHFRLAYTVSRAILSDAIALTRGDRFFTADYTPYNMTAWGFADCQRDAGAPGYGSTLGRLFMRTLPDQFKDDSAYTWFPLMTPDFMQGVLTKLGDIDLYSLKRPEAAKQVPSVS